MAVSHIEFTGAQLNHVIVPGHAIKQALPSLSQGTDNFCITITTKMTCAVWESNTDRPIHGPML
jgi:hypothetical protein